MIELDFLNLRIINVHYVEEELDNPPKISEKALKKDLKFLFFQNEDTY